jgi:hypothetical protein
VIGAILSAVGLQPHDSAAQRAAALASKLQKVENERAATERAHNEARSLSNASAASLASKLQAESEAHELALSVDLASEVKTQLEALFSKYHAEGPSRKLAVSIATCLREANARSVHTLGAEIDPIAVAGCFAAVLVDADQSLVSVFADLASYYGPAIAAATDLVKAQESGFAVTMTEMAMAELERSLEHTSVKAPRSAPTPEHHEAFEVLRSHAIPSHRSAVTADVLERHGKARDAAFAAAYVPPTNVANDGGLDDIGREWAQSKVTYADDKVERGAPVASKTVDADDDSDSAHDEVTAGFGLPEIDFNRI